ncbi:unnamed protein product [Darwinula stevensoni]|uniref:Uncharacterized protein n=1 Tax=Darwinula stevensoni TaxID=69355 RepID=A0A7R8X9S8_9CRUS|nr:unnamed protein product [Darwinula stevensoni]CAG0885912.1 unnamed protein product [Darwinula stevensoni]
MRGLAILWLSFVGVFGEGREECGGVLTDDSGVILSPNYPEEYPVNSACIWFIMSEFPVILTFEEFFLDGESSNCEDEYVKITNFGWATFCGEDAPSSLEISDTEVTVIFKSDAIPSAIGDRRFRISYRVDNGCEIGWNRFQDNCYLHITTDENDFSLNNAEARCQAMGAHVASVHSEEENQFIAQRVRRPVSYIGASAGPNFSSDRNDFEFLDGTPTDFSNFNSGEVYLVNDNYFVLMVDKWINFPCDELRSYICANSNGSEITVWPSNSTFEAARSHCSSNGRDLMKISDQEHMSNVLRKFLELRNLDPATEFWIGLRRDESAREWLWVQDGSESDYDNWVPGYPTGYPNHDCAATVPSTWATVAFTAPAFTCKKLAASP